MAVADKILGKDLVCVTGTGVVLRGRNEFKHFAEAFRNAFPDIRFEYDEEIIQGENVCTRYVMRGTFLGTLMGLLPTGSEFAVRGIDTFRVVNGVIVDIQVVYDTLGQMEQLGVVPKI